MMPFDRDWPDRITVEFAMELTGWDFMTCALHPTYRSSDQTISTAAIVGPPERAVDNAVALLADTEEGEA